MNALKNIALLAGLFLIQACDNKEELGFDLSTDKVKFSASLSGQIATRALNNEIGDEVALPYINGIYLRKGENVAAQYEVQSGYKGTLANTDGSPITWDSSLENPVQFYGWTAPTGVVINAEGTDGTVDFNIGNTYLENEINKVNENFVTPLEVFIGTPVVTSTREASPSVSLPFKHLVSKLSIRVRDWKGSVQNDNVLITFLGIKNIWSVGKDQHGIQIMKSSAVAGATDFLTLVGNELKDDEKNSDFKGIYLPPLTTGLGLDFKTAGDFVVEWNGAKYFGTLDYVGQNITELQAGEHLHVTMDLSENFGIGVATQIVDWNKGEEDIIEGNPYKGIYTYDDLKSVAKAINEGGTIPPLLIDNGTIRLYRNIQIGADWEPINISSATSLIFDGNGYTVSGLKKSLFGSVDGSVIKNLALSNCTVAGAALLVADAVNTTVASCRVTGLISVTNTNGDAGGLIGTAGVGVAITNCSVETLGAIAGANAGALVGSASGVTITNCFAVLADKDLVALVGSGTQTISYSYFWNTFNDITSGSFWGSATTGTITFDKSNVAGSTVEIAGSSSSLLDALQAGGKDWVYVYGKGYPVLRVQ